MTRTLAAFYVLLILYILIDSLKLLLSVVAPSNLSLNWEHIFSTSSSRLSVSHTIGVLDSLLMKTGIGRGVFFGDLEGLGVSAGKTGREASLGMWDGVLGGSPSALGAEPGMGTCTSFPPSAMGAGREHPSSRCSFPSAVLKERSRIDLGLCWEDSFQNNLVGDFPLTFGANMKPCEFEKSGVLPFLFVLIVPNSSS